MGDPASSYTIGGIALRILWTRKPHSFSPNREQLYSPYQARISLTTWHMGSTPRLIQWLVTSAPYYSVCVLISYQKTRNIIQSTLALWQPEHSGAEPPNRFRPGPTGSIALLNAGVMPASCKLFLFTVRSTFDFFPRIPFIIFFSFLIFYHQTSYSKSLLV
jgi:hypothetical protein